MILLTIIIPVFNAADQLVGCLESIQKQSNLLGVEIIIQDGNSTDHIQTVVDQYRDLPITFLQSKDTGVYDAMNRAIEIASGRWLYFMGCDDRLYDNRVITEASKWLADSEADFVHAQAWMKNAGYMHGSSWTLDKLLFESNICHQAIFYRKTLFARFGLYNLRYPIWADWEFNIRCFRYPDLKVSYWPRPIAVYNDQAGISRHQDPVFSKELPVCIIAHAEKKIVQLQKKPSLLSMGKQWLLKWKINKP